jgi:hypothetical protein
VTGNGTYNPPMQVREAKDFLVAQTAQQAALENVPLSDLEKRMMYFTEAGECPEDPIKLNEEFEAQYDATAYEEKVSRLLAHACLRLKRENPELARVWDQADETLWQGDHYLVVLCGLSRTSRIPARALLLLLFRMTVLGAAVVGSTFALKYLLKLIGISLGSFLFFAFAIIGVSYGLRPKTVSTFLMKLFLKVTLFLVGRRKNKSPA